MSLIDQFYEEYDNLMIKYGGVNKFFNILGDNYPEKMTIKMDMALDEFLIKHRPKGRRKKRELSVQLTLERAWALGA